MKTKNFFGRYECDIRNCNEEYIRKRDLCRHLFRKHKWNRNKITDNTDLKMGGWVYYPIEA